MKTKQDCIFCKIVRGEIPCVKIWEDEFSLVFLDAFPSTLGQCLIIPKEHLSGYAFELEDQAYLRLLLVSKKIARAIDKSLRPIKTGLVIEGIEVDHVHIKLFPLTKEGLKLKPSIEPKPSEKEMNEVAERIKKNL